MADIAALVTELNKPEYTVDVAAGNAGALRANLAADSGPLIWSDIPFSALVEVVGDNWILTLTNAQFALLRDTHTDVNGNLMTSQGATRTALMTVLDAAQEAALQAQAATQETKAGTLGLGSVSISDVRKALHLIPASRQFQDRVHSELAQRITAVEESVWLTLSTANLQTIEAFLP